MNQQNDNVPLEQPIEQQVAPEAPAKKKKRSLSPAALNAMTMVLFSTILTLICLAPIGYFAMKKMPKPMGMIDLQALVNENQNTIINALGNSGEITEHQRMLAQQQAQQFATKLSKSVEETAKECGCVLINKAAVLTEKQAGVLVDYTDKIRQDIKK